MKSRLSEILNRKDVPNDIKELIKQHHQVSVLNENSFSFRDLVFAIDEGVTVSDLDDNFLFVNSAAEKLFGVEKGELVGKNIKEFLTKEQFSLIEKQTERRRKGFKDSYEITIIHKSGIERNLLVSASPYKEKFIIAVFRNIDSLKMMKKTLMQKNREIETATMISNEFLKSENFDRSFSDSLFLFSKISFSENVSAFVFFEEDKFFKKNKFGQFVKKSVKLSYLLRDVENFMPDNQTFWSGKKEDFLPSFFKLLAKDTQKIFLKKLTVQHQIIGFILMEHSSETQLWGEGEKSVLDILVSSVSAFLKKEETFKALQKAKKEAEEANRKKNKFLSEISHEIRTPLNGIVGMGELLTKTRLSETQKTYVELLNKSAKNLKQLISDVLDLSKITNNSLVLTSNKINLREMLIYLKESVENQALIKNLSIEIQQDLNIPSEIWGDELRLNQILLNFLTNAIKFSENNKIILKAKLISNGLSSAKISFSVQDFGVGIKKENIEKIFDRFWQTLPEHNQNGAGIGLFITKQIAETMGGKIEVHSKEGVGSTFFFTADFSKVSNNSSTKENNFNILLAEDNEDNAFLFKKMIKSSYNNANLTIVENGQEAVDFVKKDVPDIIFLDKSMPIKNGWKASEEIADFLKLNNKKIPIILITANADEFDFQKTKNSSVSEIIIRPIDSDRVKHLIDKTIFLR